MEPDRVRVELVNKLSVRFDKLIGKRTVHFVRVPAMEVHGMRVRTLVHKANTDAIALRSSNGWTWHLVVIGPCWKVQTGCYFNFPIGGDNLIFSQPAAIIAQSFPIKLVVSPT